MRANRFFWLSLPLALATLTSFACAEGLFTQGTAARLGLTRAWFAQVGASGSTGPIMHMNLDAGLLLVQTEHGRIAALDSETGRSLWSAQVGSPRHTSTEPDANDKIVAAVSGANLYVFDRSTGALLWQRALNGTPGAGPGVSATHVFVPMMNGFIEGYEIDKAAKGPRWNYKSAGRVLVPPTLAGENVVWTTNRGYMYAADGDATKVRYRLETRGAIEARPAHWTPNVYACSTDGNVYAVDDRTGKTVWKFTIGDAIYAQPVALEGKVFVISEQTGMYCLDAKDGAELWHAPRIGQFVSLSPTRVYAIDKLGQLTVLDGATGARLGSMPLRGISIKLVNRYSDRIYLASDTGMVQCLRETPLKTAAVHQAPALEKVKDVKAKPKQPKKPAGDSEEPSADEPAEEMPAEEAPAEEMPADDAADAPAEPAADDADNPFK